jgi:hypothetical protein
MSKEQVQGLLRLKTEAAMARYHQAYDNDVYLEATEGKSVDRCNHLLDSAMALCNHPRFAFQDLTWDAAEWRFLALFLD